MDDQIIEWYLNDKWTMQQIAEKLNIKYCTVHNILTKNKINRKLDPRRKALDYNTLYNLYVIEKLSKPEIQKRLRCCKQTLDKNLKYFNITSQYVNFSEQEIIDLYTKEFKSLSQINNITSIPKSRIRNILLRNNIKLRDKSTCQCINLSQTEKFINFDISILKSQSKLKRKCQAYFKNHISSVIKKERDNKCEICGDTKKLHAHHIISQRTILSQIIKENLNKTEDELYSTIINDPRFLDKTNIKIVCEKCHYTIYHPYVNYHVNQQLSSSRESSETIPNGSTSQANGDGSALHLNEMKI